MTKKQPYCKFCDRGHKKKLDKTSQTEVCALFKDQLWWRVGQIALRVYLLPPYPGLARADIGKSIEKDKVAKLVKYDPFLAIEADAEGNLRLLLSVDKLTDAPGHEPYGD